MIVKIIFKKLRGHLNLEEDIFFKKWLAENKENLLTYKRLKDFEREHGNLPNIQNLDPTEAWGKIASALQKNKSKKHIRFFNQEVMRYAAIFIIIAGGIFFYKSLDRVPSGSSKKEVSAITLELGNGETQLLSQHGITTIVNSNSQVVGKKGDNIVDYMHNQKGADSKEILEYNTIHIPNGRTFQILLSDGTLVYLNSGSSLKYPTKFITGGKREVTLIGEAFFDVHKDEDSPFIVSSGSMGIRVLGTKFNVSSYPEDEHQSTVLVEGSVSLYEAGTIYDEDKTTLLSPGFKAEWDDTLKTPYLKQVNTDLYTGWIEGKLIMRKMKFSAIIQRLQRHYGVKINNDYEALNDRIFTATFETETLKEVMETFQVETPFLYDINDDEIRIYKERT